jgi:PPM family protein phosphatase
MKLIFDGATDTGLVRSANQDAYYLDPEGRFFIVADGMGGHAGGEEASRLATDAIRSHLESRWSSGDASPDLLRAALLKANEVIIQDQQVNPQRSDMGPAQSSNPSRDASGGVESAAMESTEAEPAGAELAGLDVTFTASPVDGAPEPWCAHVGDSRLYRLRGATLEQITEDHTWVNKASKLGVITMDQVKTHPWRHVLSQCLGRPDLNEVSVQQMELKLGDRLLLCSDGLTEEVSDHLIAELLKTTRACEKVTLKLIASAKDNGGRDNITVIVIATDLQEVEA